MSLIVIIRSDVNIKFKLSTISTCQYRNQFIPNFTCDEYSTDTDSEFCIFHDKNYLKGDNYEKRKEEVAKRFDDKLSEYSSNHRHLDFIGYCLPDISFHFEHVTGALDFSYATFYGVANFNGSKFSNSANSINFSYLVAQISYV
jgi:hypothetical protein